MNYNGISAVLIYAFSIYIITRYRVLPVEGTPYWFFGILIILLTVNIVFSITNFSRYIPKIIHKAVSFLPIALVVVVITSVMMTAIVDRSKSAPIHGVHDIILQQEAAMRYILEGKNPYKETYFGTPLESWNYSELGKDVVNPALYHFVMPPWYVLFPFLFYFTTIPTLGFFDARFVLLFLVLLAIPVTFRLFKNKELGLTAVTLLILSPATFDYLLEGRSDMFALSWLLLSLFLLEKRKFFFSAVIMALALLSKQTIWFAFPFYIFYTWLKTKKDIQQRFLPVHVSTIVIVSSVCLLIVIPFLLHDSRAFLNSVVFYLSGNTEHSYPVSGYGLGMLLFESGIIKDIHAYYPFILWQVLFGVPVVVVSGWWLMKKPVLSRLFFSYALSLAVIWYMSRYFNNSHMAYLSTLFGLGVLKHVDEVNA